ncbi:hypothetical protein ACMAZF_09985 [Psychrobium sp. nBUS_13]|uniref:hypothetical protein n=1 Tax=Psychrobium sp. nBUS_13 TaxID=3395319 RepID=UPI003EB890E4
MNKRVLLDRFHLLTYAMTIVGWALLIYALIVFDNARPEMATVVTNYFGIDVRQNWLRDVYDRLKFLLWFCAVSSFLTLIFNYILKVTHRERISMAILLLFVVSAAAISLLLILNPTAI